MKPTYIYLGLVVLVVTVLVIARNSSDGVVAKATKYDDFAQCLGDAGAKFYGSYWCPSCAKQKELLEKSPNIPYVECSTPDGKGQNKICSDLEIKGYPTWIFADSSRVDRVMELSELSEKTSCELPQI
jgi:thiol-disulfide isomerase/thioredoxin